LVIPPLLLLRDDSLSDRFRSLFDPRPRSLLLLPRDPSACSMFD